MTRNFIVFKRVQRGMSWQCLNMVPMSQPGPKVKSGVWTRNNFPTWPLAQRRTSVRRLDVTVSQKKFEDMPQPLAKLIRELMF